MNQLPSLSSNGCTDATMRVHAYTDFGHSPAHLLMDHRFGSVQIYTGKGLRKSHAGCVRMCLKRFCSKCYLCKHPATKLARRYCFCSCIDMPPVTARLICALLLAKTWATMCLTFSASPLHHNGARSNLFSKGWPKRVYTSRGGPQS